MTERDIGIYVKSHLRRDRTSTIAQLFFGKFKLLRVQRGIRAPSFWSLCFLRGS